MRYYYLPFEEKTEREGELRIRGFGCTEETGVGADLTASQRINNTYIKYIKQQVINCCSAQYIVVI